MGYLIFKALVSGVLIAIISEVSKRQPGLGALIASLPLLSVMGMIAAAFGYLTPVQGALLQEVIDVAVILNALRALRIAPHEPTPPKPKAVSSGQDDIAQGATP